ncbi:PAC2 family-domain-containing protein [Flammula alnicola]|nr:PAC2 family-domain-containing protein [Flammula alnicola]
MTFIYPTTIFNLEGKTIIIPVVSTANVGQLAVDLIVASLSLERIAVLEPGFCVPVVGAREDGQKGITTSLELYGRPDVEFVVVQQRSPVLKSKKEEFIKALFDFIKTSKFSAALFLSGVDLSNRTDAQMMTPTYQIRPPNSPSVASSPLKNLLTLPIPIYTSPVQQQPSQQQAEEGSAIPFIPGGGLTRRILSSIPAGWDIPTASLLQFVLEGDNRADAGFLASVVVKVLGKDITQWKQPSSWRDGLFGSPHDQTLYG